MDSGGALHGGARGWGGFTEVPPGEVQVEIGGNVENCQIVQGWPGTMENSIRMPVRAGHHTRVRIECVPREQTMRSRPIDFLEAVR